jgi:hypothetical protein
MIMRLKASCRPMMTCVTLAGAGRRSLIGNVKPEEQNE